MSTLALKSKILKHWKTWLPKKYARLKKEGILDQEAQARAVQAQEEMERLRARGYQEHEAEEVVQAQVLEKPEVDGLDEEETKGRVGGEGAGVSREPASRIEPDTPAANFRITDELELGKGSELTKFNDNLNAVETLKAIEGDERRATPDEQRLLARYVGWGCLANAFPST